MTRHTASASRLIRFNKPHGVLSQFTAEGAWRGLKDFIDLPDVYVAGRLDADSEGLLLLTKGLSRFRCKNSRLLSRVNPCMLVLDVSYQSSRSNPL
jgi:hypothetical protein